MELKQRDDAAFSKEELKRLREKTDKSELAELKRGLMGGYRKGEVDQFVGRLKDQLQTAERTYKSHIAVLTQEKDALRGERDELTAKLAVFESAANTQPAADPKDLAGMEEYAASLKLELAEAKRSADEATAARDELSGRLQALSALADENTIELECKIRDAELRFETQAQECESAAAALGGEIKALEARLEAKDDEAAGLARKLDATERKLVRKADEAQQMKGQLADIQRENCRLAEKAATLERESEGLTSQLEVARQNILHLLSDKETADSVNTRLRETLNSLVVKADAVTQENAVLATRLEEERGRARQYRAMHEALSDKLARVRMACSMLDDRVLEADRTLMWCAPHVSRSPGDPAGRAAKADPLDFSGGYSDAMRGVLSDLKGIQSDPAQYQTPASVSAQPRDVSDNMPDIRFSVEKLEVEEMIQG